MKPIVFIDSEINIDDRKIMDLGAVKPNHDQIHTASVREFVAFTGDCEYLCGHNNRTRIHSRPERLYGRF